jgi:4-hydroxybenzoate polyprenyltransferase/phosphoserine phosphatase
LAIEPQPPAAASFHSSLPLCVDLDGTLLRTDSLVESSLAALQSRPAILPLIPFWLFRGRAVLKRRLAAAASLDASLLPLNPELLAYLREQKLRRRRLVLATAADRRIAEEVARHLDLFDEVIASDGRHNLKGAAKAEALVERFGERGFAYAGNSRADLAVWKHAGAAVVVGASAALTRAAGKRAPIEHETDRQKGWLNLLRALLRAVRPYQWAKNLLVFVPILTSGDVANLPAWLAALVTFVAFCFTASGIYLVNDLFDLQADRKHKRKRNRPLARGDLPALLVVILVPLLISAGLLCASITGVWWVLLLYTVLTLLYSFAFKSWALVDIFLLAGLYTVRLFAGGIATGYHVSHWLLGFSGFLFLDLAIVKRVAEIQSTEAGKIPRRGYMTQDSTLLQQMGVAAAFVSSTVLALYMQSDVPAKHHELPEVLWGIVPLMLFWQCRLWLATSRGKMHDDPIVYAFTDKVSWSVFALLFLLMAIARFGVLS